MTLMHYIGGAETAGTSGRQQDVFNPATGAATTSVPLASTTTGLSPDDCFIDVLMYLIATATRGISLTFGPDA